MKANVISIINNKGGVGKTMTAQNLSSALAAKGKKVCMIDLDSQHNLTNRFENEGRGEERLSNRNYAGIAIEDYMTNPSLEIQPIEIKKNLFLIPATIRLAEISAVLYSMKASDNPSGILKAICEAIGDYFDYIVVDSEPGMSAIMVNATIAANMIIIPVNCMDALEGASEGVFGIMGKTDWTPIITSCRLSTMKRRKQAVTFANDCWKTQTETISIPVSSETNG